MLESIVHVPKNEYEELVRDQHKVELLTNYFQKEQWMDSTVYLILGIEEPKMERALYKSAEELLEPIAMSPEQDALAATTPQSLTPLETTRLVRKK